MRNKKQLEIRATRVALGNELLLWMKEKGITGARDVYPTLGDFCKGKELDHEQVDHFELWKAWDILRETKRVSSKPGGWKVLDFSPIKSVE